MRFAPTTVGEKLATLDVTAAGLPAAHASLAGTSINTENLIIATPSSVDFGAIVIGQTTMQVFTLSNEGGITQPAIAFTINGAAMMEISLAQDTCTGVQLAPGKTCTLAAIFAPTSVGGKQVLLTANVPAIYVGLSGSGIATASDLAMSPTFGGFGNWSTGTTSSYADTFTVTNRGTTTTASLTSALVGTDTSQFAISSDTCAGTTLAPGATCAVGIVFSPTSAGAKTVSVQVSSGSANATSFASASGV